MEFPPDSGHDVPIELRETMSRRPRRNHTPGFKAKVAFAAIKGDRTLAQLAEQSALGAKSGTTSAIPNCFGNASKSCHDKAAFAPTKPLVPMSGSVV